MGSAFLCIFDKEAWMDLTVGRTAFEVTDSIVFSAWRLGRPDIKLASAALFLGAPN